MQQQNFKSGRFIYIALKIFVLQAVYIFIFFNAIAQPDYSYRFQFHKYNWSVYRNNAYSIYYVKGMDSVSEKLTRLIPESITSVKKKFGTSIFPRPDIILYPSTDQMYESNVGLNTKKAIPFPMVISKGNRIVLTYNSSIAELVEQLKEAIGFSIWERQISGSNLTKPVGINSEIPEWFKEGIIHYNASGWTVKDESEFKRIFHESLDWTSLVNSCPVIAGKAFSYYLDVSSDEQIISRLFDQLKKNYSLKRSIRIVTKKNLDTIYSKCFSFYSERFLSPLQKKQGGIVYTLPLHRKNKNILDVKISADKNSILYLERKENFCYSLYLYNKTKKHRKKILTYFLPPWLQNISTNYYPQFRWNKGERFCALLPSKGQIKIYTYNSSGERIKEEVLPFIDGVQQFYWQDKEGYILNAFKSGQNDIVSFTSQKQRYSPLTNDSSSEDNLTVNLRNRKERIYFTAYEKDTVLKVKKHGIYTLDEDRNKRVIISDTLLYNRYNNLHVTNQNDLVASSSRYGIEQFVIISNDTMAMTSIEAYPMHYNELNNTFSSFKVMNDSLVITFEEADKWIEYLKANPNVQQKYAWLTDDELKRKKQKAEDSMLNQIKVGDTSFLDEVMSIQGQNLKIDTQLHFFNSKPYFLELYNAYFTVGINNDYFINRYQPYLNYMGQFKFPEIGAMIKSGFTDIFENHHFSIGYRMPTGSEGSDFFFNYRNTKKRLDWSFTYFRKVESLQNNINNRWTNSGGLIYPAALKVTTHFYEVGLGYPLTYFSGIKLNTGLRKDHTVFLATDKYSLPFEALESTWIINDLSYNLTKLKTTLPLLYKGMLLTVKSGIFIGLAQKAGTVWSNELNFVYHQPLYRFITLSGQLHSGYSLSPKKILYNLGGVDNNLTPRIDSSINFSQNAPYAFQTLVTPVRGYLQNTRYGDQYVLVNIDVTFPLFQTLLPLKTPLSFINLFQPGVFSDLGLVRETFNKNKVPGYINSFGLSAQSKLAGYTVRFDIAWPANLNAKPIYYLSVKY